MAEDFTSGLAIGILLGVLAGIPIGWIIAQAANSGDSIVALERDPGDGRISAIIEKRLP